MYKDKISYNRIFDISYFSRRCYCIPKQESRQYYEEQVEYLIFKSFILPTSRFFSIWFNGGGAR